MSSIGKSTIIALGDGRKVVCSELTVAQARQFMLSPSTGIVEDLLFDDIRLSDLPLFTDLTDEEISGMVPSELSLIVGGCREANPDFFRMLAKAASYRTPQ